MKKKLNGMIIYSVQQVEDKPIPWDFTDDVNVFNVAIGTFCVAFAGIILAYATDPLQLLAFFPGYYGIKMLRYEWSRPGF